MVGGSCLIILILIILLLLLGVLFYVFHIRIDIKSLFRSGFHIKRGLYGTYCFNAPQGKGKTMALAYYCYRHNRNLQVYSNVLINNLEHFTYFENFDDIYSIVEQLDNGSINLEGRQMVIIWDELFSLLGRSSKLNRQIVSILSQMRKRKIIFLTTCQDWSSIPIDFRRLCRFCIDTSSLNLLTSGYFINVYKDAERMKWDDTQQDFVAPIVWTKIYKANKVVANSYDTNQTIKATNTF